MKTFLNFTLIIVLLCSCENQVGYKLKGETGASRDIEESKKRNKFIQEYKFLSNGQDTYKINNVLIEHMWKYGKTFDETWPHSNLEREGKVQFVINFFLNSKFIDFRYNFSKLPDNEDERFRRYTSAWVMIDSLEIKDTILIQCKYCDLQNTIDTLTFVKINK